MKVRVNSQGSGVSANRLHNCGRANAIVRPAAATARSTSRGTGAVRGSGGSASVPVKDIDRASIASGAPAVAGVGSTARDSVVEISTPHYGFSEARQRAKLVGLMARTAGMEAFGQLHGNMLRDAFALTDSSELQEGATAAGRGAARAAAKMVAETSRREAKDLLPPPAAAVLAEAAYRPPANPELLIEKVAETLEAIQIDADAVLATVATLMQALTCTQDRWNTAPSVGETYALRAAIGALVEAEVGRLQESQKLSEGQWKAALDMVSQRRVDFQKQGFLEKAACCAELVRQMTDGLRGFVVQRSLKSVSVGLDALARLGHLHGILSEVDPSTVLPLISKARIDAQGRVRGLSDVTEREVSEVEHWASRGRLPDGEKPPPLSPEETYISWDSLSDADAIDAVLAKLEPQMSAVDVAGLPDGVVATLRRLDALSKLAGEARESAHALGQCSGSAPAGTYDNAASPWSRIADALGTAIREFSAFGEELLEVLDLDACDAQDAVIAWNDRWLSSDNATLAGVAMELAAVGPHLTAGNAPIGSPTLEPLLLTLRGLRTLASDHVVRARVVKIPAPARRK